MALEVLSGAVYHDTARVPGRTSETNVSQDNSAANINIREIPAAVNTLGSNQTGREQKNGQKDDAASEKQIKNAISKANNKLKAQRTRCEFSYNVGTKSVSIKVLDEETEEVIKEIPPKEALEMIEKMWELAGLLVDERR
jgi:flagellar protein FlaG